MPERTIENPNSGNRRAASLLPHESIAAEAHGFQFPQNQPEPARLFLSEQRIRRVGLAEMGHGAFAFEMLETADFFERSRQVAWIVEEPEPSHARVEFQVDAGAAFCRAAAVSSARRTSRLAPARQSRPPQPQEPARGKSARRSAHRPQHPGRATPGLRREKPR
jgi:hypothetical protein